MSDRTGRSRSEQPQRPTVVRIENAQKGVIRTVLTLGITYHGLWTHYRDGKNKGSRWCNPAGCPADLHRLPRQWKGYFAAAWLDNDKSLWIPCVWELTEHSELDVRGRFGRGQAWKFSRAMPINGKSQPVVAELLGAIDPLAVPPDFEIRPTLVTVYHAPDLVMGDKNPMPPRTVIEATPHVDTRRLARAGEIPADAAEWERWRANGHAKQK